MRCEKCQGTGIAKNKHYIAPFPCPYCMGNGIAYCCDTAGSNQPNVHEVAAQLTDVTAWPIKGSECLYEPIDIHKDEVK